MHTPKSLWFSVLYTPDVSFIIAVTLSSLWPCSCTNGVRNRLGVPPHLSHRSSAFYVGRYIMISWQTSPFFMPRHNGVWFVRHSVLRHSVPSKFVSFISTKSLHRSDWNLVQMFYHKSRCACGETIYVWQILLELSLLTFFFFLQILDCLLSFYIVAWIWMKLDRSIVPQVFYIFCRSYGPWHLI